MSPTITTIFKQQMSKYVLPGLPVTNAQLGLRDARFEQAGWVEVAA